MSDPQKVIQGRETRRKIYLAIRDYWWSYKMPPCIRDIQELAGISSTSIVAHHLAVLRKEGLITWEYGENRTIVLIGTAVILPEVDERYV